MPSFDHPNILRDKLFSEGPGELETECKGHLMGNMIHLVFCGMVMGR